MHLHDQLAKWAEPFTYVSQRWMPFHHNLSPSARRSSPHWLWRRTRRHPAHCGRVWIMALTAVSAENSASSLGLVSSETIKAYFLLNLLQDVVSSVWHMACRAPLHVSDELWVITALSVKIPPLHQRHSLTQQPDKTRADTCSVSTLARVFGQTAPPTASTATTFLFWRRMAASGPSLNWDVWTEP